jgi:hypothetical protein
MNGRLHLLVMVWAVLQSLWPASRLALCWSSCKQWRFFFLTPVIVIGLIFTSFVTHYMFRYDWPSWSVQVIWIRKLLFCFSSVLVLYHAVAMHMFGSWFCRCGSTLLGGLPLQLFDKPHIWWWPFRLKHVIWVNNRERVEVEQKPSSTTVSELKRCQDTVSWNLMDSFYAQSTSWKGFCFVTLC